MTTSNADLNWIVNYIWGIADDVLRDRYAVLDQPGVAEKDLCADRRGDGCRCHRSNRALNSA